MVEHATENRSVGGSIPPLGTISPSQSFDPLAALDRVGKRFANGTEALDELDLDVGEGEFLTLLGPSGCGKSTALRLLAGLSKPTAGRIRWKGHERPEIGLVFQTPTLMPWASVFDNVRLPLRLRRVPRRTANAAVEEALTRVGLMDFRGARPRELSGGMAMRASIARSLVTRPSLLLMDEPFAALDEITRFRLNDTLLSLWRDEGLTVVFVTHSIYEAAYLSSRIAVMSPRPGRIVAGLGVEAPYPRGDTYRTSSEYLETCRAASAALRESMAGGEGLSS